MSIANNLLCHTKPWQDVEESYTPIAISLARDILNNVCDQQFSKDSHGWIFVLCSDEAEASNNATFLLSCCISASGYRRGIAEYFGIVRHEDKSAENLIKRHRFVAPPSAKLDCQMESLFEISPNVSLKFSNNMPNPSINHIDRTSEVVLYQQVEVGKCHALHEDFWSQIELLNFIKNDILNFKNSSCDGTLAEPPFSFGLSDQTFESLQERVNRILSDMNIIGDEPTDAVLDTGLEAVVRRARQRPLVEITDQLWDLLKFTSSYGDLKKTFTFIFQIASRSNIVNIPTNHNRLGELIRELCLQRLAIPHLVGTEPLELLLEIGIEKLLKDYEFIFAESKICKLEDMIVGGGESHAKFDKRLSVRKSLSGAVEGNKMRKTLLKSNVASNFIDDEETGVRNSRFVEREVESNITRLTKIHLAVEHLLLIQNNLSLDNDYTSIVQRLFEQPLAPLNDIQQPKFDKFEFPINDKKVCQLVDRMVPNSQKIILQSGNKFKDVQSVFYFNIEQIVPPLDVKEKEGEVIDKLGDSFHFTSYTSIDRKY